MSYVCPDLSYVFATHIPIYQGESPTIAVMRKHGDDVRIVRIREILGRSFHDEVMMTISEMAVKLAERDKTPEIYAHLVYSGAALSGPDVQRLLGPMWPSQSYSYIKIASGGVEPILDATDERLPMNQFKVPRLSLINSINYAYNDPGRVFIMIPEDERKDLDAQLGEFAERTMTVNPRDPEALMEYKGEGRVICLGTSLWHHFNAHSLKARWASDVRDSLS